jgi:uncharacterized membrane protein YeaQ/YmgE (transglycosylase-associated protein family)
VSVVAWIMIGLCFGLVAGRTAHLAARGFVFEVAVGVSGCVALGATAHRFVDGLDLTFAHVLGLVLSMGLTVTLLAAHHAAMAAGQARAAAITRRPA